MGSLGLCVPAVPGLAGWQEHGDLQLEEEQAARAGAAPSRAVPWAGAALSFQGQVSTCFCRITSANVTLHVFPGLLGLMAKLLVSPRDFLNPPVPGALSWESLGRVGSAGEPVLLPLQPSVKHRGVNINFIIKLKTSLDFSPYQK